MKEQFPYELDENERRTKESEDGHQYCSLSQPSFTSSSDGSPSFNTYEEEEEEEDSKISNSKKVERKYNNFAYRIHEHVKLGAKLSETVKGKLRLGARIIQEGGREKMFKKVYEVKEGEELLKASQCYISTTAGPIAGLLFISTHKVAFWSERPITFPSTNSTDLLAAPYKVSIPIMKIEKVKESENVNNPAQKYIKIVTKDNFEFWFMGFLRYEKAYTNLHKAVSMANLRGV